MARPRRLARLALGFSLSLSVVLHPGCVPPERGAGGATAVLYVANGADGTVTRIEAPPGRVLGPPLPAGPSPGRLAAGPAGRLLVLATGSRRRGELTLVARSGAAWEARPLRLAPGAEAVHIAGDGGAHAAVVYRVPGGAVSGPAPPCRLALLDLRTGAVEHQAPICSDGETVVSLALERSAGGPVANLGTWRRRAPGAGDDQRGPGGGRILAVRAATGAVIGEYPLEGPPGQLVAAPGPAGAARRLYAVQGVGGAERVDPLDAADYLLAARWRVLALHPTTLAPEREYWLDEAPRALVVSDDGAHAYAYAGAPLVRRRTAILHLDLGTGAARYVAAVPGSGVGGLAAAGGRLFAPDPEGGAVSVVDPRWGAVVRTIPVGGAPLAIVARRRGSGSLPPRRRGRRRKEEAVGWWRGARWAHLAASLVLLVSAGCAPPAGSAPGAPARLYVANGGDGTVTRLDGATGRALGPPRPAGPAPWRLAAGPGDTLLVLRASNPSALTHVAPAGRARAWTARPAPLEAHAALVLLAGDGRGRAALAYRVAAPTTPPAAWPCRVVLFDVATGTAAAAPAAPCAPGETILSLALGDGPTGPTAYLGLWRHPAWDGAAAAPAPTGGRLRAVDFATGAVVAAAPLAGAPEQLVLAAGPGGTGRRLYVVEGRHRGAGAPDPAGGIDPGLADHWLVGWHDPLTLASGGAVALAARPGALVVPADGDHAYALGGPAGTGPRPATELVRVDLRRGAVGLLGSVPGSGTAGLAVAGDRLYVPDPVGNAVAVVDRHSGAPLPPVKAGRGPVGIALAGGEDPAPPGD